MMYVRPPPIPRGAEKPDQQPEKKANREDKRGKSKAGKESKMSRVYFGG
jgi:hypothetical protein